MKNYTYALAAALLSCSFAYSDEAPTLLTQNGSEHHRFYVGPDIFVRDSNTVFEGLRLGYDDLKPEAFYFGMDGLVAVGEHFNNHWKSKHPSLFANIEQRYGYTFQSPISGNSTLTPFAGIGWYHTSTNWYYGAAGLRMTQKFCENFDVGFNLKAMYAFANNVGNHWRVKNNWGYEVGLPLTWYVGALKKWDLQFQPYLLKNVDNTDILGIRLQAVYSF